MSIVIGIFVLCFVSLGTFQVHKCIDGAMSMLKNAISYPSAAVADVNNILKELTSEKPAVPVRSNTDDSSKKVSNIIVFLLGSILLTNEKLLVFMLIAVFMSSVKVFKKDVFAVNWVDRPPDMIFYQLWRLKFITPIQKCVQVLAEKYDINSILTYGRGLITLKKPALCSYQTECGFFLCINYGGILIYEVC